jgi:hypothetical protein
MRQDNGHFMKVWRLHPGGCRVTPAEKTLDRTANPSGVRYCGPFTNANRAGWWLFPPVDVDIVWKGGTEFEATVLQEYSDVDRHLVRFLLDDSDEAEIDTWSRSGGRTKFTWGLLEPGVVQIWTGCIFETPPGWTLQMKNPSNIPSRGFRVMDAIIETDWLHYDIWLNLAFERPNELVQLRRDSWPPIAHLVPIPRESYDVPWQLEEETINRNSEDAERIFSFWLQYNKKKFAGEGKEPIPNSDPPATKDPSTYYKERKRVTRARTAAAKEDQAPRS